jgi:hypothetical protein
MWVVKKITSNVFAGKLGKCLSQANKRAGCPRNCIDRSALDNQWERRVLGKNPNHATVEQASSTITACTWSIQEVPRLRQKLHPS